MRTAGVRFFAMAVILLGMVASSFSHSNRSDIDADVVDLLLVSSTTASRTETDYRYRIKVANRGRAVKNAMAYASLDRRCNLRYSKILDNEISLGTLKPGSYTLSSDTFTVRVNKSERFSNSCLDFKFYGEVYNTPPVANAGPDQVVKIGATVTLDGTKSTDADGDRLRYIWKMTSKPAGSNAKIAVDCGRTTFKVDKAGTYVFTLVVNDGRVNSAADEVRITTNANAAPIADAGPDRTVARNTLVRLDGSASKDPNNDLLTYRWTIVSRPLDSTAALVSPNTVKPSITLDKPGDYTFQLIVNDGQLNSAPDTVTLSTENSSPVAHAGADLTARIGLPVTLDGSLSTDADGDALSMSWTWLALPDGSKAVLEAPTSVTPRFTPDVAGLYTVQLIVNDGFADSEPDTVTVTIEAVQNQKPTAGEDRATTSEGTPVDIDVLANDSDPDLGTTLNIASVTQPASGGSAVISGRVVRFTPAAGFTGLATFTYTITDGSLTATANVTVTVEATNRAPVVNAGNAQSLTLGSSGTVSTTLVATVTDDNRPAPAQLTLGWTQVSGPTAATIASPTTASTQVQFSQTGTYVLRMTASDGALTTTGDVQITVVAAPNSPPVMAAIPDRTVPAGTAIVVALSATDPNPEDTLTFEVLSAPSGAQLVAPTQILWTAATGQIGTHTFNVSVRDKAGATDSKSFKVTVTAPNHAPQLAALADDTTAPAASYSKTLSATDADGDALTYELLSGPSGMALNGGTLNWQAPATNSGPFTVSVRVSDPKGATAAGIFKITMVETGAPLAVEDSYSVKVGGSLTVPAPGVLANDKAPGGATLASVKRSDPAIGSLSAFGADGGFTFAAPSVDPRPPFEITSRPLTQSIYINDVYGMPLVGDINKDGYPDVVYDWVNQGHTALSGRDGSILWHADRTGFSGCADWLGVSTHRVLADIDDDGNLEYVFQTQCGSSDHRFVALDSAGRMKWISPFLTQPYTAVQCAYGNGQCFPEAQVQYDLVNVVDPSVARLTPSERPVILFRRQIAAEAGQILTPNAQGALAYKNYGCAMATGLESDMGVGCRATFIVSTADGTIQQILKAPLRRMDGTGTVNQGAFSSEFQPPFTADLDGDGQVEIISGSDVWRLVDGQWTLAWQTEVEPAQVMVADLDGDGRAEVIQFHIREGFGPYNGEPLPGFSGFIIYDANGVEQRRIPMPAWTSGYVTIADVDGDSVPEFLIAANSVVTAMSVEGAVKWGFLVPDNRLWSIPDLYYRQSFKTNVQVYDLDGDGVKEVIVSSHYGAHILDGRTGEAKVNFEAGQRIPSLNTPRMAYVLDMNNDGHADILSFGQGNGTLGGDGSFILTSARNDWLPAGKSYHQPQYRMGDIDDSGHVNYNPSIDRSFRNPRQLGTIRDPREIQGTSFEYAASTGSATSNTANVFLKIAPDNSPPVITSRPPGAIQASSTEDYIYTLAATDPDVGDTITYSIVNAPSWVSINSTTGAVKFDTGPCGSYGSPCEYGRVTVMVAAKDSLGAEAHQTFVVNVTMSMTSVPNVVGQSFDNAKTIALAAKLNPQLLQEQYSSQPIGTVIAQNLPGSSSAPLESQLLLTVSKGLAPVQVPSLVGLGLANASDQLTGLGLVPQITAVWSTTVPAGQVISQSSPFGSSLPPTTSVELTVSAGPEITAAITQLFIDPKTTYRLTGETVAYKAVGLLADGSRVDVSLASAWTSSAPAVASVDALGRAKALSGGSTSIGASYKGKSASVTLNVSARVGTDAIDPVVAITAPTDGSSISSAVQVTGTAMDTNLQRYELSLTTVGTTQSTLIATGTTAVSNGVLGVLDPAKLLNGVYALTLTAFDRNNNRSTTATSVTISGDRKIGLFSITFRDVEVPVAGLPIVVTRTYDSRDKMQRDFGIGWRLGVQSLELKTNRVLGTGWVRNQSGANVSLSATSDHKVTILMADGKLEEFDMVVSPTSNLGSLDATRVTAFRARPGTRGTLQMLGNDSLLIVSGGATVELVDDETLNTFDPQLFRYTTADGTQIEISRSAGVRKMVDASGNSLTIGAAGIIHSSGKSVTFTRDLLGRITEVTDPMGRKQRYTYDGNGDLVSHADALSNTTRFTYDDAHGLIDILDPLGRRAARNEYDDQGRLVATIDANGKRIAFEHNDAAQEDVITDRLGNQSRVQYDANGNVTSMERTVTIEGTPVNARTTYAYDAQGNQTSERNPDGVLSTSTFSGADPLVEIVDPNGLALQKTFAYLGPDTPSSIVDAGGRTFAFTYDASGRLTSAATPMGGTTTVETNARGETIRSRDSAGTLTTYTYDASGNIAREDITDASGTLLRRVDFTYDANGNKLTETLYRTIDGASTALKTAYAYDATNRLTSVTDPAGGVARIEYDAVGHVTAQVDALGRRTVYEFDSLGLPAKTTYPNGTFESYTYDFNGNMLTQTDTAGRVTRYAYDELGRRIRTTLADGTFTQTVYSAGGRVTASIDAKGNRTEYVYDSAGRNTGTVMPSVATGVSQTMQRPRFDRTLTALGTVDTLRDPNGHVTTFRFDANGRLIESVLADGSSRKQSYDVLGRRTEATNEDGETTRFSYDGLGRLVGVSGARGTASYTYDEAGNLLTQTDELGRATQYRYDRLNRPIEKRYPDGAREQYAYDAVGNMTSRTDPNGKTIGFEYSNMNRLTRKSLPGGSAVTYAYANDGQRSSVTDSRGTTSYAYDALGRLAKVTNPGGQAIDYVHDANGNLTGIASGTVSMSYVYDQLDRLSTLSTPEGLHRYYYDLGSNQVRSIAPNGVTTDSTFDSRDRVTRLAHSTSGGTALETFVSTYSPAGRLTQSGQVDGSIERFGYDSRGRLISENRTGTNPFTRSYVYDAVGNLLQATRNGITTAYTYNNNDQLVSDGTASFAYDANGNLVTRTAGGVPTTYGYDAENRLTSAVGGSVSSQYAYDDDGNRVEAITATGTTRFLVDSANNTGLSQVLEERDGAGAVKARYAYGYQLASMTRGGSSSYVMRDSHRNVRALSGAGGAVTDRYTYDGYGNSVASTGSTENPYRYSGQRLDSDTGLYQLRARYYSPATSRFLSRDPLGGSLDDPRSTHRYTYAGDDPINASDPTGLMSYSELNLGAWLNALIDQSNWVSKVTTFCKADEKLAQLDTLAFLAQIAVAGAAAGTELLSPHEEGVVKYGSGVKTDFPLLEIENKRARVNQLKKISMSLSSSAGKVGVKTGFEVLGDAVKELEVSGPPLTVKGAVSEKEKFVIKDFKGCGIKAGELIVEMSGKGYGGVTDHHGAPQVGIGVSFSADLKLSILGNQFKTGIPLLGADFDGVKRKMTLYALGVSITPR